MSKVELTLEDLFKKFNDFLQDKYKQDEINKRKGLNDYNILSVVSKNSNELLHSNMLGSFLDIEGSHYQGTLFLDIFLKVIKIDGYDTNHSTLYLEKSGIDQKNGRIDIYLTDGTKHIIIENKINALDQPKQLKRYLDIIYSEYPTINMDDIYVIYLSKDRIEPKNLFKYNYEINGEYICESKVKKARYKAIHYKTHILEWLDLCQKEVYNISNLNEAIKCYKEVVEKITGQYKKRGIDMKSFLVKNEEYIETAFMLHNNFSKMMGEVIWKLFQDLENYVEDKFNLVNVNDKISKDWVYDKSKCQKWFSDRNNRKDIGSFFKVNDDVLLFFFLGKNNFHIGIVQYEECKGTIKFQVDNFKCEIDELIQRNWKKWKPYTIDYGNFRKFYKPNIKKQKEDIENILNCVNSKKSSPNSTPPNSTTS